ncbi:MAG: RNA polymerase sigma factor [Clostridia bacterium]|nr:RNA polymerase sigma factor [Clostridia bacterium]
MLFFGAKSRTESECDAALAEIAGGNKDKLEVIYNAYARIIISAAYQIVQNREDSEDVLQDVMLKIVSRASSYVPGTSPRAWVIAIARNTALDKFRSRHGNVSLDEFTDSALPEQLKYEDSEEKRLLGDALRHLTHEERLIINLKLHSGMKYKEISAALDMTPAAAQKKYERAIKKLRGYFEEKEDDDL